MANDLEVIVMALRKEREELHQKLMQIDRIIKRVQGQGYETIEPVRELQGDNDQNKALEQPSTYFPKTADIKVQVLRVFDIVGHAARLRELQDEYNKVSGNKYNIREVVRSLQAAGLLKIMKQQNAIRGSLWVKSAWVENGQLIDKYKPEGFDLLYPNTNITFE